MTDAYDPDPDLSDGFSRAVKGRSLLTRLGTAAGVLIGRSTLGSIGLAVVIGSMIPRPGTDGQMLVERDISAATVAPGSAEGQAASRPSVSDEPGRELAVPTRWRDGEIGFVARCGAVGLCCWFKEAADTAYMNVIGKARETRIEVQPDGTAKAATGGLSRLREGPGARVGDAGTRGISPRARTAMIHHALDGQPCQLALDPRS